MSFLDMYPLPLFEGLPLAVTATRALERYGDLVQGLQKPAALAVADRFDLIDECLDVVVPNDQRPAGYEFTGLSLAEFWAALRFGHPKSKALGDWSTLLQSDAFEQFRETARKRVGALASGCHLASQSYWLPEIYQDSPLVELPAPLEKLQAINLEWIKPRRSRWAVEMVEELGRAGRRLPVRGQRYPQPNSDGLLRWQRWSHLRLQHRPDVPFSEYFELQLCLPSLEESYFNPRTPARNVFAHVCATRFFGEQPGQVVMLLDEVFSEWLDELACQNRSEPLPTRKVTKGQYLDLKALPCIPPCPVAEDWLELALAAFIELAKAQRCSHIAWVPSAIRNELLPELPLADALVHYDQEVQQTLVHLLGGQAEPSTVAYQTCRRNVLVRHDDEQGYILVGPDGRTRMGEPVKEWAEIERQYLEHAEPVTEHLPCLCLPSAQAIEMTTHEDEEVFDPDHGNHWDTLYDMATIGNEIFVRDLQDGEVVDQHPCIDLAHGSDRAETVTCLRWGNAPLVHDVLVVSDSQEDCRFMFSAYPVILEGMRYRVTLDHFEPWPHGIEAWAHVRVTEAQAPVCFFDTRYYAGSAVYQPGQVLDVSLAGLAYFLRPIQMRSFEIREGPLWEMDRQRRLEEGESEEEASRPVTIHMTGGSIFVQLGGKNARDDAQFQGVIEAIASFLHDGQTIYRLEMTVMRPDDQSFRLPVFISEYALDGYVPQLGEDVEGLLWLQGRIHSFPEPTRTTTR
jgi:hypothetical protein